MRLHRDSINMRAARIASLTTAASLVYTGSSLPDPQQTETIALDLIDAAAYLAAELARDTEEAEYGTEAPSRPEECLCGKS